MSAEAAKLHLQHVDPVLYQAIRHLELPALAHHQWQPSEYFSRIAEDIIGQQLSVKVAEVLTQRFRALFADGRVSPEAVLALADQQLRDIGMSWAKVKYVKDLAEKTQAGSLDFGQLHTWDDEEVIIHLTQIKGIGRWTAEMFLIFTLGRPDVFSPGDLGLLRAMQKVYGLSEAELKTQALPLAAKWAPYRSYACLGLWRTLDNMP